MRHIKCHAVLAICLSLVTSVWSSPVQTEPMRFWPYGKAEATPVDDVGVNDDSEAETELRGQSIKFGPVEPLTAYANTSTIILRESPEASSPIIARVAVGDYEAAVILEAKRNFVRVRLETNHDAVADVPQREQAFEGWTTWDAIVPGITALVLDAETGTLIARVPLPEGSASVAYSPDGSRAMFFNGDGGFGTKAYEVQTSDYTFTRTLASSEDEQVGSLFYGPADGDLYASTYLGTPKLMRVGNEGLPNTTLELAPDIKISPDGRIGIATNNTSEEGLTLDVIDMATLAIRNTFVINGSNTSSALGPFALSRDGSELYVRLDDSTGPISVIDTRTGQVVRQLVPPSGNGWSHFLPNSLVGDSLLVRVWAESEDEMGRIPKAYWISGGESMLAEPGVDYAVQAGGRRLAVNDDGTLLFRLDNNNRIQERLKIDRPERGTDREVGNGLTVFGLSASPDGKHIIMFVGTEHGC